MSTKVCELCEAVQFTQWYVDDEVCWVADCEVCDVPMVVWRQHGVSPSAPELDHMIAELTRVVDERLGEGAWRLDKVMRQIPDHFHAHARRGRLW